MARKLIEIDGIDFIASDKGLQWFSEKIDSRGNIVEYQKQDLSLESILAIVECYGGVDGIKEQIKINNVNDLPF